MAQAPSVYNIETGLPFVDALAAGLIERLGGEGDPLALARAQVLLPNRRACRALADAFLRLSREQPAWNRNLGKLECDAPTVPDHFGADLDQLFAQRWFAP